MADFTNVRADKIETIKSYSILLLSKACTSETLRLFHIRRWVAENLKFLSKRTAHQTLQFMKWELKPSPFKSCAKSKEQVASCDLERAEGTCSLYKFKSMADFRKKRAVPLFPCFFVKTHPWLEHYVESDSPKPKEVNGLSLTSCKNSDCIICTRKSHWNFLSNHLTLNCNANSAGLMKSIGLRLEVALSQK